MSKEARILVAVPVGFMGLAGITFAIWWLACAFQFWLHSHRVEAVVVKLAEVRHESPPTNPGEPNQLPLGSWIEYVPVVRFEDAQTPKEILVDNWMQPVGEFSVGQKVTIMYPPGKTEEARIPCFSEFFLVPLVFGGAGAVLTVAAVMLVAATRRTAGTREVPKPPAKQ